MANSFDFLLRWVILGMAYLPVVSCLFCVIWTVLTKSSLVYAAAMTDCPESSFFPTVSVSIGPWEPQRLVWIASMLIHAPMRICVTVLYPTVWPHGKLRTSLQIALICEAIATLLVCVFHVQSIAGEAMHAVCFTFWSFATGATMLITITLHKMYGRDNMDSKLAIFGFFLLFALTCASAHPFSTTYCYKWVYAIFCLSEYALMISSAAFWVSVINSLSLHFDRISISLYPFYPSSSSLIAMDSLQSSSNSFAAQLAQSLPSTNSSDSNSSPSSITASLTSSIDTRTSLSTTTGMTYVSNPFYIGNLSSTDQERLRNALNRAF